MMECTAGSLNAGTYADLYDAVLLFFVAQLLERFQDR